MKGVLTTVFMRFFYIIPRRSYYDNSQKSQLWMHLPAIDYRLLGAIYDVPKEMLEKRIDELITMFDIKDQKINNLKA